MSRDFSSLFFYQKTSPGPNRKRPETVSIFLESVELFVFGIDSSEMNTPGSRLESLR
jgi:hypothetical protein